MINTTEKNVLLKDADNIWYSLPQALEQEFISLKEDIINSEIGSNEWFSANERVRDEFGSYEKSTADIY